MRLNDLCSGFDNAAPTFEQKQRMLNAILAKKEEDVGAGVVRRRTKRLTLAVAVLAVVMLTATVAFAVSNGWHERFLEYFGIGDEHTAMLEGAVGSPGITVSENGVTVEVLQTLADSQGVYVLFEVTVPDEYAESTNNISFGSSSLHVDTEMRFEPGTGGYSVQNSGLTYLDRSGNMVSALAYLLVSDQIADGTLRLLIKDLGIGRLTGDNSYEFDSLIEGEWSLEWDFTYIDTTKKVTPNIMVGKDNAALVTEIAISPFSFGLTTQGPTGCSPEDLLGDGDIVVTLAGGDKIVYSAGENDDNSILCIVSADGEETIYRHWIGERHVFNTTPEGEERSMTHGEGISFNSMPTSVNGTAFVEHSMNSRLDTIIDPDAVVSVTIGGVVIPFG